MPINGSFTLDGRTDVSRMCSIDPNRIYSSTNKLPKYKTTFFQEKCILLLKVLYNADFFRIMSET